MSSSDLFRKPPAPPESGDAIDYNKVGMWRSSYLWGFTSGFPMRHSTDREAFARLIGLATGDRGAVTIGASFHPYQLVNAKGVTVWQQTLVAIITQKFCDLKQIATTPTFFHMNPPGPQAFPILIWPDKRLTTDVTPAFGKYVPFVIPYADLDDGSVPHWRMRLAEEVATHGHAHAYLESINAALRFLLPDPAFVVGFGILDEEHPETLVEQFVTFAQQSFPPE
ncbi:hypothetical protein [Hyalangium versicolor]|uniref:hypothetical protein n=1 Tax=Hyalangium versicolor TaxID=2861190 RepID=UPI001CCEDBC3|nr:hypothetical protein [Hyalangium versicolor]